MNRRSAFAALALAAIPMLHAARADDGIGFIEKFALSPADREEALKQLIPGTEDFYYYHALHQQNLGNYAKVQEILNQWIDRHGQTARAEEIQNRQALLTYDQSPKASLDYITRKLDLHFNHQKEVMGQKPAFPTSLDQNLISRKALLDRAFKSSKTLDKLEDRALDWVIRDEIDLDTARRRDLLKRLQRPDYPNLVSIILADLATKESSGFGQFPIHQQLLKTQLDELLKLKADLLNNTNFIHTYLTKLRPPDGVDLERNAVEREAYLERLWNFVKQLEPAHNALKACVLYQRLVHDRSKGIYNKERFLTYIQIPRPVVYINPKYLEKGENRRFAADLNADFRKWIALPIIGGNDEELVRSYLLHFFVEEDSYKPYALFILDTYLKPLFAEAKIVNGIGDMERWASLLTPAEFQALKERIDIDFAPTNPRQFAPGDPVSLTVTIKNVANLIVKVYEINALTYYAKQQREINTDLDLDGLVANKETTFTYKEAPLHRLERKFTFPELNNRRGIWVIELIGNGRSSRALVRKGHLQYLSRIGAAGEVFKVLDESNQLVKNASIWMGGNKYTANEQSEIVLPFSTQPGRQTIVLDDGTLAALEHFQLQSENYALSAGFYVDREQLIARRKATLTIRPVLRINGEIAPLSVLEDVRLRIISEDLDGIQTSEEMAPFKLETERETTYEFQVPDRLLKIRFELEAKVEVLSTGGKQTLAQSTQYSANEIDKTEQVKYPFLTRAGDTYLLDLLGKTGEVEPDRAVRLTLKHHDFRQPVNVTLKTDATGRIVLGALADVESITADPPTGKGHQWSLRGDLHSYAPALHMKAGDTILVPYMGRARVPDPGELSLLDVRGGTFVENHFNAMKVRDGFVEIAGLAPGDYSLLLKHEGVLITLRVENGEMLGNYLVSTERNLQIKNPAPLQIVSVTPGKETLAIKLANSSKLARVNVTAVRFLPEFDLFRTLALTGHEGPMFFLRGHLDTLYTSGRKIGDEYRYILDRKYAEKFPGNMLTRPGLLLQPWEVRDTQTGEQFAELGEQFKQGVAGKGASAGGGQPATPAATPGDADFGSVDFLKTSSSVFYNLQPDKDGLVSIKMADLGDRNFIRVVAIDPLNAACRDVALPDVRAQVADIRLAKALDPKGHFTEQKQITILRANEKLQFPDLLTTKFETYDDLAKVQALFLTLSNDPTLAEFGFILKWPELKDQEKREKYSKYACHELNFYLSKKDPAFFETVIQPYLRNKKDKTFLDHYLIGSDLKGYLEPWAYSRLNAVERILLGRRLKEETLAMQRHVRELYNLLPPDPETWNRLFDTALQGRALSSPGENQLAAGAEQAAVQLKRQLATDKSDSLGVAAGNAVANPRGRPHMANGALAPAMPPLQPAAAPEPKAATPASEPREKAKLGELDQLRKTADPDSAADKPALLARIEEARKSYKEEEALTVLAIEQLQQDGKERGIVRRLFRQMDATKEWAENNYYHRRSEEQNAELVTVNAFWDDFATWDGQGGFLSKNFARASRNFTEMMFALALLDLPFTAGKHKGEAKDTGFTIEAASPIVVFHREIKKAELAAEKTPILVSENFFRQGDRYRHENNEQIDKFVTEEFLTGAVYGCQVVVTNPTSSVQKLTLLLQIPERAMPEMSSKYTRSQNIRIEPYSTQKFEYYFYFPGAGDFPHYPVNVSKDEKIIASSEPFTFHVVNELSKIDKSSWEYISQNGSNREVITFLEQNNVLRLNLDKIAWRMRDLAFFRTVTGLLAKDHVYSNTLWSYGIQHNDLDTARQFLLHADDFLQRCGAYLVSQLLTIDPVARKAYQHLEYSPLVNARTYRLGPERKILNNAFREQYLRLMQILSCKKALDGGDRMSVTYYLLLQDRVADALPVFSKVDAAAEATRLQHDYFAAYVAMYKSEPATARQIAAKYADYPVDRWRTLFSAIINQVDEIEGKTPKILDKDSREQQQEQLAATQPSFEFKVENKKVEMTFQNLKEVTVNYYLMDLEFLFSTNPFVSQDSGRFSIIKPNKTQAIQLPAAGTTHSFALPREFHSSNVLVEMVGAGQTKGQAYYANTLGVQIIESYGIIQITEGASNKPLPTTYVKVYARTNSGEVRFYKDGYTDLRGKFDYSSLNTNELDNVQRFSILVMSANQGAVVREAAPPKR